MICQHTLHTSKNTLDSYSLLIVSKYFESKEDFMNVICVNSKFKQTTEKLRYNPISIISLKLFPKIQTQYLYDENDMKIKGITNYEIWYKIDYEKYLNLNKQIKCHHIELNKSYRWQNHLKTIPIGISMLGDSCFSSTWMYATRYIQCKIKTITIPNYVTYLGNSCFSKCHDLINITLSNNLINLSNWCFYGCKSLSSIHIPSSIQSIGEHCFGYCSNLREINIPNYVINIGKNCFEYCSNLYTITLPSSLEAIGENCFLNCINLTIINTFDEIFINKNCFTGCTNYDFNYLYN